MVAAPIGADRWAWGRKLAEKYFERDAERPLTLQTDWTKPWTLVPVCTAALLALLAAVSPSFYSSYIQPERGLLEIAQVLISLSTILIAAMLLTRRARANAHWLRVWILLMLLGAIYVAGEEASWGQHYLGWATPESWQAVNDQGETNIHNTSSWFDQKPRALLEIAVLFGALLLPLAQRTRFYPRHPKLAYLIPSKRCVPTAAMVLLARADDWAGDLLQHGSPLFYRPAEVEELFIYMVILFYALDLLRRVRHQPPPA